jgi:hypothetical protein
MSILNKLTEGIVRRDLSKEGAALLSKWEKTGLLEGLNGERAKHGMASLLENQAKELLREASSMAGGDVEGFSSVAFPIVRRVFGGLIANDLVSVQPMSLPSGLIFFLDFTYDRDRLDTASGSSVYGGGVVGSQITGGVSLADGLAEQSYYALNNGYSSPTGSLAITMVTQASGVVGDPTAGDDVDRLCRFDPDLEGAAVAVGSIALSSLTSGGTILNIKDYVTITLQDGTTVNPDQVRRLTRDADSLDQAVGTIAAGDLILVCSTGDGAGEIANSVTALASANTASFVIDDNFDPSSALGSVVGNETWGLENQAAIPEIDIKVDSVAVTAKTKKLKAKWTPELAQDLNAYHNLDAEVELTSILSEHIALEIDQEILEDLIKGSTASTLHWSRLPGKFVNRETGAALGIWVNMHSRLHR